MVEYKKIFTTQIVGSSLVYEEKQLAEEYIPKTDKHNCISIHNAKDSWNREEVEELCRKAHSDGYDDCMTYAPDEYIEHLQERWIKENL